jgi:hypothetical protein
VPGYRPFKNKEDPFLKQGNKLVAKDDFLLLSSDSTVELKENEELKLIVKHSLKGDNFVFSETFTPLKDFLDISVRQDQP